MKKPFIYIVKESEFSTMTLAGLTPVEWLIRGVGELPYRVIEEESQAILPKGADAVAILYPDTPLVTAADLASLLSEMQKRGADGFEIGRGSIRTAHAFQSGASLKRRYVAPCVERLNGALARGKIERSLYRKIAEISVQNGAIIPDVDNVRIDALSRLEEGVTVEPYVAITASVIHKGARIGAFSEIESAEIGAGAVVSRSVIKASRIGAGATVGPFAYIRMGSAVGDGVRIGDFVEVKNSTLGAGTKAAHLAYVGDADVGQNTNIGCGTVFANYDGKTKHKTTVGNGVFLGANTNLVAPLTVGDGAYIAAATTVTENVPQGAFVIGRSRQENKEKRGDKSL